MDGRERHLVLGGARSGKTRYALELAELAGRDGAPVVYVATAAAGDAEMAERIARHRAERPQAWRTMEAPHALAQALRGVAPGTVIIIDCLTLWLSNAMLQDFDEQRPLNELPAWVAEHQALLRFLEEFAGVVIMVSNEVGSGIVPLSALARRFQDEQGRLNQRLAALCERVTLVVAGIPVPIKSHRPQECPPARVIGTYDQ
jgi:adenosylcobinamide kinase/adenosylcobinamide-phosphate guanylyltransferase